MTWFAVANRSGWGAAAVFALLLVQGPVVGQDTAPAVPLPPPTVTVETSSRNSPLPETGNTSPFGDESPLPGLAPPPPPITTPSTGPGADGTPLNDYWRNGLRLESKDKAFSIFIGGRFQFDVVNYLATTKMRDNIPGTNRLEEGVTFRRIRFDMGGTLYKNIEYFAQVDFANGFIASADAKQLTNSTYPTDMWVQWKELPYIGTIRVGNQKGLYSFEHLVSSRFLPFMERSLGYDAFVEHFDNGFEPGITAFDTYAEKHGTWGVGVMKTTRNPFGWNVGRGEVEENARVTYLPIDECGGKYLLHLGVGSANRQLDQDQARFRSRLDARNSPSTFSPLVADTGLFFGTTQQLVIPELVAVCGPWTLQSEYYASWVQNAYSTKADGSRLAPQGTVYMQSAYGEVGYFLTGEHRDYNRDTGVFTRVVPKRPLSWTRSGFTGWGAWQVMSRYSYLDLNDKDINGGRVHDMTLGLNWFMNPNMKLQANYFLAHRNVRDPNGDGLIQGFAIRTAIDW